MTPAQQAKVDKLKATISKLREDVRTWKLKAKGTRAAAPRRPASSKGRTRAPARSARRSAPEATI